MNYKLVKSEKYGQIGFAACKGYNKYNNYTAGGI